MFLYLIRPSQPMMWADTPQFVYDTAIEKGADLGELLDWDGDTDQVLDQDKIRVALRLGVACRTGIVLDGLAVRDLGRGDELRAINMTRGELETEIRGNDELLEGLMPGWKAHGEELNAKINQQSTDRARSWDQEAREPLAAEPSQDLVKHWSELGGVLPDPL